MYQELFENLEREMEHAAAIKAAGEKLPELRGIGYVGPCIPTQSITTVAPFDPALIKEHEEVLIASEWKFSREYERVESGVLAREFVLDGVDIVIYYTPDITGATCKRNLIGYEKHPIYERICEDAQSMVLPY